MKVDEFLYSDDNEVFSQFKLNKSRFGELLMQELWSLEEASYIVAGYVPELGKPKFVFNFDYEIESEARRAGSEVKDLILKFGQIYDFLLTTSWSNHEEVERYEGMPNSLPPYEVIMYLSNNNFWFPESFLQVTKSRGYGDISFC